MRVDEAIYLLAGYGANINPNNPVAEAVKMGIEALEGLPSAEPERKNTKFEESIHSMFDHIWDCEIDHPIFQDTVGDLMRAVIQAHNNSVRLANCEDTISRQAAIDILEVAINDDWEFDYAKDRMIELHAQPEIIRCKDCKYQDENWRRVSVKWLPCMDVRTGSNWYCGSAERRTE